MAAPPALQQVRDRLRAALEAALLRLEPNIGVIRVPPEMYAKAKPSPGNLCSLTWRTFLR